MRTPGCAISLQMRAFFSAFFSLLLLALQTPVWGAAEVVTLNLTPAGSGINLPNQMRAFTVPLKQALDADALWAQDPAPVVAPDLRGRWPVHPGQHLVAKLRLSAPHAQTYVLEVPLARIDRVEVFWREADKPWSRAQAGDLVPLSQWPISGQFASFPLLFNHAPIDVMVVLSNIGPVSVPVWLMPDIKHRELNLLQANLDGMLIGAARMVILVCFFLALIYRKRAAWMLVAYSVTISLTLQINNGFLAAWYTPDWMMFNDLSKHFSVVLLSAMLPQLVISGLDPSTLSRTEKMVGIVVLVVGLIYAILQAALFPYAWRAWGIVIWVACVECIALWLWWRSARQGGNYIAWVGAGILLFLGANVSYTRTLGGQIGLDYYTTLTAALLMGTCLLLMQVLVFRERSGRDVLGRAKVNVNRDPLTALLSLNGFERSYDQHLLRQKAMAGHGYMLYFALPDLDESKVSDGYVQWQRDLVSFAAVLQRVLGQTWHIARLDQDKFGAICISKLKPEQIKLVVTQILSQATRKMDSTSWVDKVDLRIVLTERDFASVNLMDLLREMDAAVHLMPEGKRIAHI
jgi:GGDEF domain-containing protein